VPENKVLNKMFGPELDKVSEQCRIVYNEEFHEIYRSCNIVRIIISRLWGGGLDM